MRKLIFSIMAVAMLGISYSSYSSCYTMGELEEGETRDGWCNWRPEGYQCESWGAIGAEPDCDG